MTDQIPSPQLPDPPPGPPTLSVEQVLELEKKLRENKAAQMRGDPMPHELTPQMLHEAVNAIRKQRGTLKLAETKRATKGAKSAATIEILDLDGL
jgi:type IV secretory pathway VirB10-like protein